MMSWLLAGLAWAQGVGSQAEWDVSAWGEGTPRPVNEVVQEPVFGVLVLDPHSDRSIREFTMRAFSEQYQLAYPLVVVPRDRLQASRVNDVPAPLRSTARIVSEEDFEGLFDKLPARLFCSARACVPASALVAPGTNGREALLAGVTDLPSARARVAEDGVVPEVLGMLSTASGQKGVEGVPAGKRAEALALVLLDAASTVRVPSFSFGASQFPDAPEVSYANLPHKRRFPPTVPPGFRGAVRCGARVVVSPKGEPLEVLVDDDCPRVVAVEVEKALRRWRWRRFERATPVHSVFKLVFVGG